MRWPRGQGGALYRKRRAFVVGVTTGVAPAMGVQWTMVVSTAMVWSVRGAGGYFYFVVAFGFCGPVEGGFDAEVADDSEVGA